MAKVGIVCTPFILTEHHNFFMESTLQSIFQMQHSHELDILAIANHIDFSLLNKAFIETSFNHFELNDRNNLARSWNRGIDLAFERGCDFALVTNLDIAFHHFFLEELITFASTHPDPLIWSGVELKGEPATIADPPMSDDIYPDLHFCVFLCDRRLFKEIGRFDEQFEPAYHEDQDMRYRIQCEGKTLASTNRARFFHFENMTLKGAHAGNKEEFLLSTRLAMNHSMELYKKKWGGLPNHETFTRPYERQ